MMAGKKTFAVAGSPTPSREMERGSAYIVTLLALVVLSIMGLSLVLVTQTEMQVGSNERTLNRVFYSADAGTRVAIARALVRKNHSPGTFLLNRETNDIGLDLADQVQVSRTILYAMRFCAWCASEETASGDTTYQNMTFVVNSTARRVLWQGPGLPPANPRVLAEKAVGMMLNVQPLDRPPPESLAVDGETYKF
jgi:hypothetical protein